jgi:FlaG/FlaF family flagellin (archaellin)
VKSLGAAVIGLCALVVICAGVARATVGGGATIASAPVVPAGAQRSGDTSTYSDTCGNKYEFWMLQLKQGDLVKITWGSPAAVDTLALFPAGTSDASNSDGCYYAAGWSHWTASPVLTDTNTTPSTTHLAQTVVTQNGNYPLLFLDTTGVGNAGAYSFTAVVLHAASVSFAHQAKIPAAGTFRASVLAPDGSPISDSTLTLRLNGYWRNRAGAPIRAHKLATATPTDGTATFHYSLPQRLWRKKIQLNISGGGSSYQAVTSQKESVEVLIPPIGPVVKTAAELKSLSKLLRQPIYWAGPRKGLRYEFWYLQNGNVFVRYLPQRAHVGAPSAKFLIVGTYPVRRAYSKVKKAAHGKAVAGPNGSIYWVRPNDPKSVLVAFPRVNYEIEVYDPSPKVARSIAADGLVRPVR